MQKLTIPYYRSHPASKVLYSEDTQIMLYENHMTIRINSLEETPKDIDDPYLGMREKVRKGTATILKSAVIAIETHGTTSARLMMFRYLQPLAYGGITSTHRRRRWRFTKNYAIGCANIWNSQKVYVDLVKAIGKENGRTSTRSLPIR